MKKYSILLVEDDELDIISVRRSLNKFGDDYELHTAYNGKEALHMLTEGKPNLDPDVILLDLNMPRMNGIEFLRIVRGNELLQHTKVFIMTTSSENKDRAATEELGISGYIIKPLNYTGNVNRTDAMDAFVLFYLRKILAGQAG